jgi:hypothetical protein
LSKGIKQQLFEKLLNVPFIPLFLTGFSSSYALHAEYVNIFLSYHGTGIANGLARSKFNIPHHEGA